MTFTRSTLALASAVVLLVAAPDLALAQSLTKIDLRGPATVHEGEEAVFYSRALDRPLELAAIDSAGQVAASFTGQHAFAPGPYLVRTTEPALEASPRRLRVKPLPPFVSPDAPLSQRLAQVQVIVEDGDRSEKGQDLEALGRALGPELVGGGYAVLWVLVGRQASRRNVDFAIGELSRRGYVIDVASSVHGYPICLGDESRWTHPETTPGMKSVRLFYTTACFGARGAEEFLKAGVKTYVAAPDVNFVNEFHAMRFFERWREGDSVAEANERANRRMRGILGVPLVEALVDWILGDPSVDGTMPTVFGDPDVRLSTDPGRPAAAKGILRRLAFAD